MRHWFTWLGLWLLTLGLVVACQRSPQTGGSVDGANCTVVEHELGTVCVPNEIQRLVTLDGPAFEHAIAVGLRPIATVRAEYQKPLESRLIDAQDIGISGNPSLENVIGMQPDFLLGLTLGSEDIYPQLSQIAPTVLLSFEHSGQWKSVFRQASAALHQTAAAEATMAAYDARTADFRAQMGNRLEDLQVSVVRLYPDSINLYLKESFVGTVLQDAGLKRPPAQDIGAAEAVQRFGNPIQTSISRELLEQADGDVIFVWTGENTAETTATAQQKLQALRQDPLWQQLRAVQAGRVYTVPGYWLGSGPIAANAVLDDLFKYLLEPS
ncbi:iron-siderophore ABC transporter substrate-binding protein [Nodosilinea sp. PGN35]|uniref:iron-siderophore ABC transporter substrate-binding protein n=1 Tax=Nodosilinea sp. PGN35 TaxID=3020489 RepID=UPI0023B3145E|nr:iron-siderophore ABC transporter substrate-binding protein [Nodosilinea sp. TSF1-S3]MDF0366437.1 iron-siderophore ABC transporter substrate-binding protein [Nodosilinea sp. TSF1-S3]